MYRNCILLAFLWGLIGMNAQEREKIDGLAVVVGKNIVLDADIDKFKKEMQLQSEEKIEIKDCEILEEIMTQKLLAHHAVVDSIEVSDAEVNGEVERNISYFKQQLGSIEKVLELYGFNDEEDLRTELTGIQREQLLIQRERASITEDIDVTPEEVRTYFKNLEQANELPEFSTQIELAQIVRILKPSEAETERVISKLNVIKKDIENGFSFRLKAIMNSDDPSVSSSGPGGGGKYTITRESGFIREFKEVAFSLDEGDVSDPFESGFGFHIVQVEKIRGQERDVRHILIQPKIKSEELRASLDELSAVREEILSGKISFEEAVIKYSEDKETVNNKGLIMNPQTNDTRFDLTRMDPNLYNRVSNLKSEEITQPFYEEIRGGEKMHKLIMVKSRVASHIASFTKDYEKIQQLTLQKKRKEALEKWAQDKIFDTYIKINDHYKGCDFEKNWLKKK